MDDRNPILRLPAWRQLEMLQPEAKAALRAVLGELATQAHAQAEVSWAQRKAPMAAYWRACGVYAGHIRRAIPMGRK